MGQWQGLVVLVSVVEDTQDAKLDAAVCPPFQIGTAHWICCLLGGPGEVLGGGFPQYRDREADAISVFLVEIEGD